MFVKILEKILNKCNKLVFLFTTKVGYGKYCKDAISLSMCSSSLGIKKKKYFYYILADAILKMFCGTLIYSSFNVISVSHFKFVLQLIEVILTRKIEQPQLACCVSLQTISCYIPTYSPSV